MMAARNIRTKRCRWNIYIISTVSGFWLSALTFAATVHAPEVQPTIQSGIDVAENGDTVLVNDGIYTGAGTSTSVSVELTLFRAEGWQKSRIVQLHRTARIVEAAVFLFLFNSVGLRSPIQLFGIITRAVTTRKSSYGADR